MRKEDGTFYKVKAAGPIQEPKFSFQEDERNDEVYWGTFVSVSLELGYKFIMATLCKIPKRDAPTSGGCMPMGEQTSSSDRNKGQDAGAAELQNSSSNGTALVVDNPTANNETKKKKKKREKPLRPSPVIPNTVPKRLVRRSKHPYIKLIDNADDNTTCFPDSIAMTINHLTKNRSAISYDKARECIPSCMGNGYRDMNDLRDVNELLNHYNYSIAKLVPNFREGDSMALFSKKKGTFIARIGFFEKGETSRGQPNPWNTHAAVFFAEEGWFADTHNVMDFSADSADPLTNRLALQMMQDKWNPNKKYIIYNVWEIKKV